VKFDPVKSWCRVCSRQLSLNLGQRPKDIESRERTWKKHYSGNKHTVALSRFPWKQPRTTSSINPSSNPMSTSNDPKLSNISKISSDTSDTGGDQPDVKRVRRTPSTNLLTNGRPSGTTEGETGVSEQKPTVWTRHTSRRCGKDFWHNTVTGVSVWKNPTQTE